MSMSAELTQLEALFSQADALPQAPKSPLRLSNILEAPDSNQKDIESIILSDPGLTAGILRAASSSLFGRSKPVTSVREAVMVLGFRTLRSLAIALWTQALFCEAHHKTKLDRDQFAKNGSFVGLLASGIYSTSRVKSPKWSAEEVYAAGVLHNMGVGLLSLLAPSDFDRLYSHAVEHTVTIQQAFVMVYGKDLNELTGMAAQKMGLPELFLEVFQWIDHPTGAPLDLQVPISHLAFAHGTAESLQFGVTKKAVPFNPCEQMTDIVAISEPELDQQVAFARKQLIRAGIRTG
ncbi:MAG: HDOD domain-containing protein [Fimbriimonadaceae bacterium]|nr:HDOD domain-containing protein [Fimbriimonadaceae bacterium]